MKFQSLLSVSIFLVLLFTGMQNLQAQSAFEGKGENRINVAWAYYGRGNGLSLMYDHGFSELLSAGAGTEVYFLEGESDVSFFGILDLHLKHILNLPEQWDVYPGMEIGSFEGDFEVYGYLGISYALSNEFGLFTEIGNRGVLGVYWNL